MVETKMVPLTFAQFRVVRAFLWDGGSNEVVQGRLTIGLQTVKTHMRHVFKVTGYKSRAELAVAFWTGRVDFAAPHRELSMFEDLDEKLRRLP